MGAKVLVIGGGGREHSLGWKLAQSPQVEKVYFAPGNGGTSEVGENVPIDVKEHEALVIFAKEQQISLTVVGPEQPLVDGIVDVFEAAGLMIFGPSAAAAQLEASKAFTADFMARHNIPQPESKTVDSLADAQAYIANKNPDEYVIKASGLAAGKGVIVPTSQEEAEQALIDIMDKKVFGESGNQVVFQQRLYGQEVSAFALSDGEHISMLPFSQDHKQIYDGDKGPNTGGVGAYTPIPFMTQKLVAQITSDIMQATIDGMRADGAPYRGVLYAGLFITKAGEPKVIEFNCRFGDPECEPLMVSIDEDLYLTLLACAKGALQATMIKAKSGAAATIILTSGGYPGKYETGETIKGLDSIDDPDVIIFHSGTKRENNIVKTNGGRVLAVTAQGPDMKAALAKAYVQIGPDKVHFNNMHYRHDIGWRVS